jgi:hypothetical protein
MEDIQRDEIPPLQPLNLEVVKQVEDDDDEEAQEPKTLLNLEGSGPINYSLDGIQSSSSQSDYPSAFGQEWSAKGVDINYPSPIYLTNSNAWQYPIAGKKC